MQMEKQPYDSNFKYFFQLKLYMQPKYYVYLKLRSTTKYNERKENKQRVISYTKREKMLLRYHAPESNFLSENKNQNGPQNETLQQQQAMDAGSPSWFS